MLTLRLWNVLGAAMLLWRATSLSGQERTEYFNFAAEISNDYYLDDSEQIAVPSVDRLNQAAKLGRAAKDPAIREAGEFLATGVRLSSEAEETAAKSVAGVDRYAEGVLAAAGRGDFRRVEARYGYDSSGKLTKHEVEVDDSLLPILVSQTMSALANSITEDQKQIRMVSVVEGSRGLAWEALLPAVPARWSGAESARPLVEVSFRGDGPRGSPVKAPAGSLLPNFTAWQDCFRGRFVARNVAERDLTNVTMAVDLYHFSTFPDPASRHVYFLRNWKSGQSLEFSRAFVLNMKSGGKRYKVPAPWLRPGEESPADPDLQGQSGVVRIQAQVWANEARQAPATFEFPERSEFVSQKLIAQAKQFARSWMADPNPNPAKPKETPLFMPALDPTSPLAKSMAKSKAKADAKAKAEARAKRKPAEKDPAEKPAPSYKDRMWVTMDRMVGSIASFMPADSAAVKQAALLLDDFPEARKQSLEQSLQQTVAACAAKKTYAGSWGNFVAGTSGIVGLTFRSSDARGKRVTAELFDTEKPAAKRVYIGQIEWDVANNLHTIRLEAKAVKPSDLAELPQVLRVSAHLFQVNESGQLSSMAPSPGSNWYPVTLIPEGEGEPK